MDDGPVDHEFQALLIFIGTMFIAMFILIGFIVWRTT